MYYMASIYNCTKNKKYSICTVLAQINEKISNMAHNSLSRFMCGEKKKASTSGFLFPLVYSMELLSRSINSSPNTFEFSVFCKRNIPWWYVYTYIYIYILISLEDVGVFCFGFFSSFNSFLTEKSHVLIEKQTKTSSRSALWECCIPQRKQRLIVPSEAKKTDT